MIEVKQKSRRNRKSRPNTAMLKQVVDYNETPALFKLFGSWLLGDITSQEAVLAGNGQMAWLAEAHQLHPKVPKKRGRRPKVRESLETAPF